MLDAIKKSFMSCVSDIVFGMEDGAVSIFGLVLGVAATTNDARTILAAGCTGTCAAAVSMMAGAYMEGLTDNATGHNKTAPLARATWMLLADFVAGSIPIIPFVLLPVGIARYVSTLLTLLMLAGLGIGMAVLGNTHLWKTSIKTVVIGAAAGITGVAIGALVARIL